MSKLIQLLLMLFLSTNATAQRSTPDPLFVEALKEMSKSEILVEAIGTTYNDENALFFHYGNLKFSQKSEQRTIHVWTKSYLFEEPVNCYMEIQSVEQKGKYYFVFFNITGEGNDSCDFRTGMAKLKFIGDGKLQLLKLKMD